MAVKLTGGSSGGGSASVFRRPQGSSVQSAGSLLDQVTGMGDPEFSRTRAGTQEQVPEARAQYDTLLAQSRAQKVQQLYGRLGLRIPDEVGEIAQKGFTERNPGLFENILRALDAPRRVVNLAIQDISGGAEEVEGFSSPNPGDYVKALFGQDTEVLLRTGHNPTSGSETLALWGWDEATTGGEKALRGVADFVLQVASDPLTYLTFGASALGKRALGFGADAAVQRVVRDSIAGTGTTALHSRLGRQYNDFFNKFFDDAIENANDTVKTALNMGDSSVLYELEEQAAEAARLALRRSARNEVIGPVVTRDFGAESLKEWIPELPAYATGGMRIALPFSQSLLEKGITIPGTRGLGRKIVGDPWRSMLRSAKKNEVTGPIMNVLSRVADNLDKNRSLLTGLKLGEFDAHTWLVLTNAEQNHHLSGHVTEAVARIGHYANEIVREVNAKTPEVVGRMHTGLARYLETGRWASELDDLAPVGTAARRQIDEFKQFIDREAQTMWNMVKDIAPDLKLGRLDNYIPMSVNKEMYEFLQQLAGSPAFLRYADAAGEGAEAAGTWYLSKVLDALGKGGRSEGSIGSNRHLMNRDLDVAMRFNDESLSVLWDVDALDAASPTLPQAVAALVNSVSPGRQGFVQLNDYMEPVLRKLIDDFPEANLRKPKSFRVFNEDVFRTMTDYVQSMASTISSREVLNMLEEEGLILAKPWVLNEQSTLAHIAERVQNPRIKGMVERAQKAQNERFPNAAIRSLEDIRKSGKLPAFASTRRAELSSYANGGWQRLYVEPRREADVAYREKYLLDAVTPMAETHEGRMLNLLGRGQFDGWEAYYSVADDAFIPTVQMDQDAISAAISRGRLMRLSMMNGVASFNASGAARTVDGIDLNALLEKRAFEFFHAHGYDGAVTRNTVATDGLITPTWDRPIRDVLKELDDDGAYLSMWDYNGAVLYGDNAVEQFEAGQTLIHKIRDAVVRRNKQFRAGYVPDDRQFEQFFNRGDLLPDGRVAAWGQGEPYVYQGVAGERHPGGVLPTAWEDVHGVVYAYDSTTKKRYIRFAGGDDHSSAMIQLTKDIEQDRPGIIEFPHQLDGDQARDAGIYYFHGENRPYDVADLSKGRLGREQSFRWLHAPGVPPAIMEEADGIGLRLAEKMGHNIYRATPWISNDSRVLRVSDNIWDPAKMDPVDVYNMVFETMRKIADAPTLAYARTAVRESPLQHDADLLEALAEPGMRDMNLHREVARNPEAYAPPPTMGERMLRQQGVNDQLFDPEAREVAGMRSLLEQTATPTRGAHWTAKIAKNYMVNTYGEAGKVLMAAVRKTTKELEAFDLDAENFVDTLMMMFEHGLDANGNLIPTTRFTSLQGEPMARWLDEVSKYGEKLGINPKTWEADWEYSSLLDPKLTNGRNFVDPSLFNVGGGPLEAKMVQVDVNKWLEQLTKNMASIYTPQGVAQLKATSGVVTRMWKTMTTITRPTFHIRNLLGGVWNNQIVGVRLRDYAAVNTGMMSIRRALRGGKTMDAALHGVGNPQTREMFRAAWNSGLLDLSFSRAEFRALSNAERTAMARRIALVNPLTTDPENFVLARAGGLFMESIEDFMRVSAFARWFDPADPINSAKVAKEMSLAVHFDYKNLTEFETQVKRFVPFFVWQRRNLPLQIQTMIERPGLMNRYQHLMNAAQEQFAPVEQDDYAQSEYLSAFAVGTDIVLNDNTPFWARIMIDPDVPVKDLFELGSLAPTEIISYFLDSLGPTYSFAQDFLVQQEFGPVNAPAPMNAVLSQLARSGLYDTSADGDVQIPYLARTIYNLLFPYAQEYEDILAPVDPRRQQQVGMAQDDTNLETVLTRLGLVLGRGLGVQTQTPSQTLAPAAGAQEQLDSILGRDFRAGKIPQETYDEVFG